MFINKLINKEYIYKARDYTECYKQINSINIAYY